MRKLFLLAGLIAAATIPAAASAATRCEQHQANNRAAGTVIGAIAGGLIGNSVSRGGGGAIVGAAGGAVVGNQLSRDNNACPDGYDAVDDGRGPGPDRRDHDRDRAYAGDGRTWRDQDGRMCSWRDQPGPDGHHWVQACE
jgi:hypothetical protein